MLATLDAQRPRVSVDRTAAFLWYTLCVVTQTEARVCQRAKELGVETYVPMSRTPPRLRKFGQPRVVPAEVRPLMPGYVFVLLPTIDPQFYLFRASQEGREGIHGALRLLSGPDGPMAVNESVIEDMRLRERNGEFDLTGLTDDGRHRVAKWIKRAIVERRTIRCVAGPFESFCGYVVKIKKPAFITVEVNVFGRHSVIDMPVEYVRLA